MFFSDSRDINVDKPSNRAVSTLKAFLAATAGLSALLAAGCAASTSSATAHNAAGVESFSAGRYDDAIAYFQESLEDNPSNAEAYYNLASAYQRKAAETGDTVLLGQAEDAYWTALENNPNSETIVCCYRGLATSAMARGDGNAALQTLEAWRDRNPDSIEPKLEIAYLLEAQQKDSEAYDVLKQVAAEAPNGYRAFYKMGVLAERAGDLTDAMENAETAHKLNPRSGGAEDRRRQSGVRRRPRILGRASRPNGARPDDLGESAGKQRRAARRIGRSRSAARPDDQFPARSENRRADFAKSADPSQIRSAERRRARFRESRRERRSNGVEFRPAREPRKRRFRRQMDFLVKRRPRPEHDRANWRHVPAGRREQFRLPRRKFRRDGFAVAEASE